MFSIVRSYLSLNGADNGIGLWHDFRAPKINGFWTLNGADNGIGLYHDLRAHEINGLGIA